MEFGLALRFKMGAFFGVLARDVVTLSMNKAHIVQLMEQAAHWHENRI